MSEPWLVKVYSKQILCFVKEVAGPLELGRRDERAGEEVYSISHVHDGHCRIPIARNDEVDLSRRQAWLEEIEGKRVRIRNLSASVAFTIQGAGPVKPGGVAECELPLVLELGSKVVRVQFAREEETGKAIQSLERPSEPPLAASSEHGIPTLYLRSSPLPSDENAIDWLRAVIRVLQSAATDTDFFQQAAQAVVEMVRLDVGRVLTREAGGWKPSATYSRLGIRVSPNDLPSRLVINRVCDAKQTTWFDPFQLPEDCSSLAGVSSAVAAPVLDNEGTVIAILYGERRLESLMQAGKPISRLDAMLVEVLAVGLSAGLARIRQERNALGLLAKFEQFFTPELAHQITAKPELLNGQDLEITCLFCDIRWFSRITRSHKPEFTLEWVNDVLSTLSVCVLDHKGVLVDYIGDELMAMWGAPEAQPDHAERACRAAVAMIRSLDELNTRWAKPLGEPMSVGVGINTGIARVGNTGSKLKFKYGPLGDTVNVASRVQGATKYFKSNLLVTRATRERLGAEFLARRIGKARVVNIAEPIELFELSTVQGAEPTEIYRAYEEGLSAFESKRFRDASRILGKLITTHPNDGPSIRLLASAVADLVDEPENFDPSFKLAGK